ncbi:hypothetical protein GUITHDRAFT_119261 [Guillardia theta CCMP2712]|uniref:Secreted protein n=1 Tax=Guillardia theta (strain CCMP2712) TaxID=905079 RepID=L1IEF1_GUITC|nr:hypothetical protein GUITHDRAFT_119261 [Guillardia theta CCMP2712]EKX34613.1 hypothetical protein GUITHDRAFT_119261 [Guillardia theta CCMP2712]|eukprot:XP_005821593.1 hypothetical protein GUITHDRAFT_119261 [Guillardia theta CCMP2712]
MLYSLKFKRVVVMALVLCCGSIGSPAHGDNDWVSHDSGRDEDMLKRIVSDAMSKVAEQSKPHTQNDEPETWGPRGMFHTNARTAVQRARDLKTILFVYIPDDSEQKQEKSSNALNPISFGEGFFTLDELDANFDDVYLKESQYHKKLLDALPLIDESKPTTNIREHEQEFMPVKTVGHFNELESCIARCIYRLESEPAIENMTVTMNGGQYIWRWDLECQARMEASPWFQISNVENYTFKGKEIGVLNFRSDGDCQMRGKWWLKPGVAV